MQMSCSKGCHILSLDGLLRSIHIQSCAASNAEEMHWHIWCEELLVQCFIGSLSIIIISSFKHPMLQKAVP